MYHANDAQPVSAKPIYSWSLIGQGYKQIGDKEHKNLQEQNWEFKHIGLSCAMEWAADHVNNAEGEGEDECQTIVI